MGDSSLDALQRFIADAISGDVDVGSRIELAARAGSVLAPGQRRLDAAGRLEIYREQFWLRHLSNLGDDFPTLAWVVGGAAFREVAVAYLKSHPPCTWNLQRLGADLPTFVSTHAPCSDDPLAVDACRLDWAFMEAFDAPDAGPLDLQVLAGAPEDAWPKARIELHPSIRRLVLTHPAHDLREAVKRGDAHARPVAATTCVIVWRDPSCVLRAAAVEPMPFALLGELAGGAPLGAACEAIALAHDAEGGADLGEQVGMWFQRWTAAGWVSAVRLSRGAA
jgi:Putative DNA-binding domain